MQSLRSKLLFKALLVLGLGWASLSPGFTADELDKQVRAFRENKVIKNLVEQRIKEKKITYHAIAILDLTRSWLDSLEAMDVNKGVGKELLEISNYNISEYLTGIARAIMHGRGFDKGIIRAPVGKDEMNLYTQALRGIGAHNGFEINLAHMHSTEQDSQKVCAEHAGAVNRLLADSKIKQQQAKQQPKPQQPLFKQNDPVVTARAALWQRAVIESQDREPYNISFRKPGARTW